MSDLYGKPPVDLGLVDISPSEMMFWLYVPIKLANTTKFVIPENLKQFFPLISKAVSWCEQQAGMLERSYVYLTAKTMHITPEAPGNRPGWHSDGYMTDDLNFIWYDSNPTLFWEPIHQIKFSEDDRLSLWEMRDAAEPDHARHTTYPNKHLLLLDQYVIHRVQSPPEPGVRTFVKISISKDRYDLIGNSINHLLAPDWEYHERGKDRNQPATAQWQLQKS